VTFRRALAPALVVGLAAVLLVRSGSEIRVSPGDDVARVLAGASDGSTVVLAPGTYEGPWSIRTDVALEGSGARVVVADEVETALAIHADGVSVSGLDVEGGSTGILVREVEDVSLRDVSVRGADLHGVEVVDASAHISGATIRGLVDPAAQGIEVRNSDGRPDTVIERTSVTGGQEGIVSHVSEVVLTDNDVSATTMRGIVVTEMSDGWVTGNRVFDAFGTGFYCGDMSRCEFDGNEATGMEAGSGGTSEAGWGLVVTYHASASSSGDRFDGVSGPIHTSLHGKMLARSPLDPGRLSDIVVPGAIAVAAMLALMFLAVLVSRPMVRRIRERNGSVTPAHAVIAGFAFLLVVQSFHMFEHALQVHRVTVDHVPSRGGLAGPGVETEWVHLAYNVTVLALLAAIALAARRLPGSGLTAVVAATGIQTWHAVEHVAKVFQHVVTGAKVNPGLLGTQFNLVWFHFTINLAVYVLCVVAAVLWGVAWWRSRTRRELRPVPA